MSIRSGQVLDRIQEVEMMCARDNPIYDQISSYSLALYVLGYFEDQEDLLSIDDYDDGDASQILKENFEKITQTDIPHDYNISHSKERYLFVMGDPVFPAHFAAVVDTNRKRSFFSKLRHVGSGYDSLEELIAEITFEEIIHKEDLHYYRKI